MCGIAGIVSREPGKFNISVVEIMAHALAHRGPDDESSWMNSSQQVLFGHRRLSIIDLSESGRQAMHYHNRYTIIYNGEIYNYLELKVQLQKKSYQFETRSDTEVILAAYDCYKEECLAYFDGMFAFALWDEQEQKLFAARDRFGEKPFFYSYHESSKELWFASEIKALRAGGLEQAVDPSQLLSYLALGYTDDPSNSSATFFSRIRQLPAAHFLLFEVGSGKLSTKNYWRINKDRQITISEKNAIETFSELFMRSLERRLRSDVPIGTSLSGGIDSATITAAIGEAGQQPSITRKTFSAIFPGFERDESQHISRVSKYFNLENFTVSPTADEFARDLEKLLYFHEAPISSGSVYIQYRVFELAKHHNVKVLLDGQGADEILAGYTKYIHWYLQELLRDNRISDFRNEKRTLTANEIPFNWSWKNFAAAKLTSLSTSQLERRERRKLLQNNDLAPDFLESHINGQVINKPEVLKLNDILFFNSFQSGLNELLRYADRNSMAHGREVRLPFLNHELVEFIFSLPSEFKIHNGWTKWLLRKAFERKLPHETVFRKDKVGFEPPQQSWMELDVVQEQINESKKVLVNERILRPSVLDKKNQPHEAYAADTIHWRYLIAGQLLKSLL